MAGEVAEDGLRPHFIMAYSRGHRPLAPCFTVRIQRKRQLYLHRGRSTGRTNKKRPEVPFEMIIRYIFLKKAFTDWLLVILSLQIGLLPEQAPTHLISLYPSSALALRVRVLPFLKTWLQLDLQ